MLVFNYRFFLLNVLIRSICMLGIKIRTVLKSELNGLHENVNLTLGVLEAEKLPKSRWPKYCETPCSLFVLCIYYVPMRLCSSHYVISRYVANFLSVYTGPVHCAEPSLFSAH